MTPFERPEGQADKAFLTEDEATALEAGINSPWWKCGLPMRLSG